jgi:DnaJ-class molecular chaperone
MVPVGIPMFVHCAVCHGSGRDWSSQCLACQGQGMVETEHTVHVRMPPRVREGTVVEVPLHGLGIHNLLLRLHVRVTW